MHLRNEVEPAKVASDHWPSIFVSAQLTFGLEGPRMLAAGGVDGRGGGSVEGRKTARSHDPVV